MNKGNNSGSKPVLKAWTDASYHEKYENIGCAAVVQDIESGISYIFATARSKEGVSDSTVAEFITIAAVLEHLGSDNSIQIYSDSHSAVDTINQIKRGHISEEIKKRFPEKEIKIIQNHSNLSLIKGNRQVTNIAIADEFAWYARKGQKESMNKLAHTQGFELRYYDDNTL